MCIRDRVGIEVISEIEYQEGYTWNDIAESYQNTISDYFAELNESWGEDVYKRQVIWTIISTIMQGISHVISNVWNVIYNAVSGVLISIWTVSYTHL